MGLAFCGRTVSRFSNRPGRLVFSATSTLYHVLSVLCTSSRCSSRVKRPIPCNLAAPGFLRVPYAAFVTCFSRFASDFPEKVISCTFLPVACIGPILENTQPNHPLLIVSSPNLAAQGCRSTCDRCSNGFICVSFCVFPLRL